MEIWEKSGLAQMINDISIVLIEGRVFTDQEKAKIAALICDHTNPVGEFTFYPTQGERLKGFQLVTGEKVKTQLLANNTLELETLRILTILKPQDVQLLHLHEKANRRLPNLCFYNICTTGECAATSIVFLRYLTALSQIDHAEKIGLGLGALYQTRDGNGTWKKFPFFYTLLWLTELSISKANSELTYTLPAVKRLIKRYENANDEIGHLRSIILHKAQSQIISNSL